MEKDARVEGSVREVVHWRKDQCIVQLPRSASDHPSQEQSSDYLGRGELRGANAYLRATSSGGLQMRECAEISRRKDRRPCCDLYGYDAGTCDRSTRMCAYRCAP